MTRRLVLVGLLACCIGVFISTSLWAFPTPIFYTPLENEADSITNNPYGAGTTPDDDFTFVPGVSGNAFQSTNSATNHGGWAKWSDTVISSMFSTWVNGNGVTVDLYFGGVFSTVTGTNAVNEGLWSMVRRNSVSGGDQYLFASVQGTEALPGRLRIGISNGTLDANPLQYKYTFNGSAANPGGQEYAPGVDIPLNDNTPYHLTMSIGNGEFKVWLDDMTGNQYSNTASPVFSDINTSLPAGYNWSLPASGNVSSSGTSGRQIREMDIGIRGFGNTGNTVNNFGGTIRNGTWIDEVSVYNGIYTPADLPVFTIGNPVLGDYNGNHEVDADDYVVWRKNFPNNSGLATVSMGDGTGDGNITIDDYDYWRAHFGSVSGSGAGGGLGGAAVPEPSMAVLAVWACLAFATRRSLRK